MPISVNGTIAMAMFVRFASERINFDYHQFFGAGYECYLIREHIFASTFYKVCGYLHVQGGHLS